jgi:hypothetical protein
MNAIEEQGKEVPDGKGEMTKGVGWGEVKLEL